MTDTLGKITVKLDADTSLITAKIAEVTAALDALGAKASSLGIDMEVAECDLFDSRVVAAVANAHRRNPHLFR